MKTKKIQKLVDEAGGRFKRHKRLAVSGASDVRRLCHVLGTLAIARSTAHLMAALMKTLHEHGVVDLDTYKTYYVHANAFEHWSEDRIQWAQGRIEGFRHGV